MQSERHLFAAASGRRIVDVPASQGSPAASFRLPSRGPGTFWWRRASSLCAALLLVLAGSPRVGGQESTAEPGGVKAASPAEAAAGDESRAHRVKFRTAGLSVDLGVGLWAWPLPMDWDGDGDFDLVVSCPDVPFQGTYLFENVDGKVPMPVFKPPVLVGPALPDATLSMVEGLPRVLVPGRELIDFRNNGFSKEESIYPLANIHNNRVRANQWSYVDYDGNGALDLIVGVGDWTEYGWDNAFDTQGRWTRGPLHGYVYVIRNTGTTAAPTYAEPEKVMAGEGPVDVYGMPSPNFADFDADGDLDLLCGEFLDGFTYFENVGSRNAPSYALPHRLEFAGQPLRMDLQMIVPVTLDWDGDGDIDVICGDEDGRVAFIENTGQVVDGQPQLLPPKYFQQQADALKFGALATPVSVDWDGDGDQDLVCGCSAGYIAFIENLDGKMPPSWARPVCLQVDGKPLRIQAGVNGSIQGPCEAKWGYTTLSVADWDHDGMLDLVVNSIWGKVEWYRNMGQPGRPLLAAAQSVLVDWPAGSMPPKPPWTWWNPGPHELVTQWRTTPYVIDWDGDGLNDLIMLDHEGYLAFFHRRRQGDELWLEPGQRIFTDADGAPLRLNAGLAGRSGRRKFCFADWDGDGRLDLLLNSRSVNLWRNISTDEQFWAFFDEGPLDNRRLAGHTTSPTVVDWNGDQKPDLLIGAEDGHFYYQPNNWEPPQRTETSDMLILTRHVVPGNLDNGQQSFENRNYVWFDVPAEFQGWHFTRTAGGETAFVSVIAKQDCTVYMAIAQARDGVDLTGWTKVDGSEFGYTDRNRAMMEVFRRDLKANHRIALPQGNWSGGILLYPPVTE